MKTIHNIRSRLQAVERNRKKENIPETVLIYYNPNQSCWVANEKYVKKNNKGQPIKGTGKDKFILLFSPDEYIPPDGFVGAIIKEGELKDE